MKKESPLQPWSTRVAEPSGVRRVFRLRIVRYAKCLQSPAFARLGCCDQRQPTDSAEEVNYILAVRGYQRAPYALHIQIAVIV